MSDYRRKLPHFHPRDACLFVTWRLSGSVPGKPGPLWLADPRIAELVANAMLIGEAERHFYELHASAVMPNHVHMLIFPLVQVAVLMRWLKGSTARRSNQILARTGHRFWQDESFDHYLRSSSEVGKFVAYIEENPVAAGLVNRPEDWRWSSAGWRNWQAEPPAPPEILKLEGT
jgi:REP element-mobilizing transposase RayT